MSHELTFTGILADIQEAAGATAALQIAAAKGGSEVYIPLAANLRPDHWLVETVGMEAAEQIAKHLGSGHVEIPLGPAGGNRGKVWAAIRRALADGKSAPEAARLAGVHQRTVRRHRNGHSGVDASDPRQGDLF